MQVGRSGCSANNITYATLGDSFEYWKFLPAADGWGRIPAWGFASVVASASPALPEGARVFGFLPMSTHLLVSPARLDSAGFTDTTAHRAGLAAAYNAYRNVDTDPGYEKRLARLRRSCSGPFSTCPFFSMTTSPTATCSARKASCSPVPPARRRSAQHFCSHVASVSVTALTSARNVDFLKRLEVYEQIVTYDALDALPGRAHRVPRYRRKPSRPRRSSRAAGRPAATQRRSGCDASL